MNLLFVQLFYHLLVLIIYFVDHILSDVAVLHFVEHVNQIEVGGLVHRLDNRCWSAICIFDFAELFFELLFVLLGLFNVYL